MFNQVVKLFNSKDQLSIEGLIKILNIKASMNWGLSDFLKSEFNELTPVERPVIFTGNIPDPNWIAGFVAGDGCFDVIITKSTTKIGQRVQLRFRITQHDRDIKLMELIIKYLGASQIYKYPKISAVNLTIVKY